MEAYEIESDFTRIGMKGSEIADNVMVEGRWTDSVAEGSDLTF
jgi:hypothetical protein